MMKKKKCTHRQQEGRQRGNIIEVALECANAGIPVVPLYGTKIGRCACGDESCRLPGKHPRTKNGIADQTVDPEQIERMWGKSPKAKIGIVLGTAAKLVAIETSGQSGRRKLRQGVLPRTVTIRDQCRRIYLFQCDEHQPQRREIAAGVRVLGDGDIIVAPSSLDQSQALFCEKTYARRREDRQIRPGPVVANRERDERPPYPCHVLETSDG
jgi:hypothetical protein